MVTRYLIGAVEAAQFAAPIGPTILSTVFSSIKLTILPPVRTAIFLPHIAGLSDTGVIATTADILADSTAVERTRPTIQRTRAAVQ